MKSFLRPRNALGPGPAVVGPVLLAASIAWAFWPAFRGMTERWSHDPRYSHGFLVPLFSAALLWVRRDMLRAPKPALWGLGLVAVGSALKLAAAYVYIEWIDHVSLLPVLAGLVAMVGGRPCLRWAWPSLVFLIFMIPLPYRVEFLLGHPLQRIATASSTFALQTIGLPAVSEGVIILIGDARIGVVDACNGLGMLFMFFAFATAAVFVIRRPVADKVVIFLSAVPISLLANITRITVTGLLHATVGGGAADAFYHVLAGWLMMPLALGMLWGELFLLSRLLVEPVDDRLQTFDLLAFGAPLPGAAAPSESGKA